MKKIYLMLISLLCIAFSAQAQVVTSLDQLSNDKVYTIRSERAFLLFSDKMPNQLCSSTGKSVGSVTYSLNDPNLQFNIQKNGDNYYLYSVGAQKYVSSNGSYEASAASVLKIEQVNNASYPWKLSLNNNELNY